ncbi:MAG: hypothetical protein HON76_08495 [Candidatus Scalindua sp.]|jgi:molybdopterin/thiamine biosynthesis adenylyltransferase|nr:hypothetical protein [Candidatus Scalindua sp.]
MNVTILDTIIDELEDKEKALLYGYRDERGAIALSFNKKDTLECTGVFFKDQDAHQLEDWKGNFIYSMNNGHLDCFYLSSDGSRKDVELETFNYVTDYASRNQGLVDPSDLQQKTVAIIGLGSGGSMIAQDLMRSGVTKLILVDFDTVNISNLCRSAYSLSDLGKKKTDALYENLLRINPLAEIETYDIDVLKFDTVKLKEIIDSSDLIIEGTDTVKTKLLINGLAHDNTIVLYPSVYDFGKGGELLFTTPDTPCFECVFGSIVPEMLEVKKGDWDYGTGQVKPMAGLVSDIRIVVSRTVKLALGFLSKGKDSFLDKITEVDCTLLLIGNENNFFIFDKPFQEVWAETEINPECICQTLC